MPSFKEQYERVKRSLNRIQSEEQESTVDYMDDLYSFFINCYHLKDWIKNDPATGLTEDEVEDFVNSQLSLQICADLANRSKHAILEKYIRQNADMKERSITIDLNQGITIYENMVALEDGSRHIAENIAQQAVDAWTKFLSSRGLL